MIRAQAIASAETIVSSMSHSPYPKDGFQRSVNLRYNAGEAETLSGTRGPIRSRLSWCIFVIYAEE